jgi:MFS family permease
VGISLMVIVAGVCGFVGLLSGRWLADRVGRRPTVAITIVAIVCFAVFTYSGSKFAVLVGYSLGVFAGANFAPAAGALVNELFPTSVRATVAGWQIAAGVVGAVVGLVTFGSIADIGNRFSIGAVVTFFPVIPIIALLLLVPETRGKEPEDLALSP